MIVRKLNGFVQDSHATNVITMRRMCKFFSVREPYLGFNLLLWRLERISELRATKPCPHSHVILSSAWSRLEDVTEFDALLQQHHLFFFATSRCISVGSVQSVKWRSNLGQHVSIIFASIGEERSRRELMSSWTVADAVVQRNFLLIRGFAASGSGPNELTL